MRLLPRPAGPTLSRLLHGTLVRFTKISRVCAGGMKDLAELQESQLTLHQGNTPQHTESSTCPGKANYVGVDGHDYEEHYDADGNKYELRACSRSAYYSDAVGNKFYYGIRKDKQKRVLVLLKLMPCPVKLNTKRYREMREEVTGSAEGKYDVPTKDVLQQWFIATRGNTWSGCKKEFTSRTDGFGRRCCTGGPLAAAGGSHRLQYRLTMHAAGAGCHGSVLYPCGELGT